jgi:asparagine synthase (glutamine-hydrolysing)
MLNELFHESVPVILHEDDLNAMYYSLENRSPFLDRELCQFSLRIPTPYLIQKGYAKMVLREAMRGIVPEKILACRRKVGFNAPLGDLIDFKDRTVRAQILDDGPIFRYVFRDKIEKLLKQDTLTNSESKFLFYFISSKLFYEEFNHRPA